MADNKHDERVLEAVLVRGVCAAISKMALPSRKDLEDLLEKTFQSISKKD